MPMTFRKFHDTDLSFQRRYLQNGRVCSGSCIRTCVCYKQPFFSLGAGLTQAFMQLHRTLPVPTPLINFKRIYNKQGRTQAALIKYVHYCFDGVENMDFPLCQ